MRPIDYEILLGSDALPAITGWRVDQASGFGQLDSPRVRAAVASLPLFNQIEDE